MYTTIRSSRENYDSNAFGGIGLLERKVTEEEPSVTISSAVKPTANTFDEMSETRAKMRENLDRLLNYDRAAELEISDSYDVAETETKPEETEIVAMSEDDIRPTSTTMQFGNDGKETVFKDMEREKESAKYKLNGKGKALVVLYALAVVVVLALIILNTGVLSVLSGIKTAKAATLAEKQEEVTSLYERIEEISSDEHVIKVAEEELHMFRG